ncbi:unnamed protein product [Linum tenue]|uniref:Uncharacterized protein n=1 Tax=Linum tenue TaxID=586396 RepID=A0AAV0RG79_9ROSI|nr:unnamed protein product [Linum tenue]
MRVNLVIRSYTNRKTDCDVPIPGSSAADWAQGEEVPNWFGQQVVDPDISQDSNRWSSQPFSSSARPGDPNNLYRTSSYPEQPQQHHQQFSSEPILVPKPSYPSYPPQASPNHTRLNIPHVSGNPQMSLSPQNQSPFSNSQLQMPGLHHASPQYGRNLQQLASGLAVNSRPPGQWANQTGMFPGDHPMNQLNNALPHQNGLMPPQMMRPHMQQQQQQRFHHQGQPSLSHLPGLNGDLRDQRPRSVQRGGRFNMRYPQPSFDSGWPQFRSKYMSTDELDGILRVQLAATYSNDPYVDDYYHQGCLFKKSSSGATKIRHHFCPTHLRDLPPGARVNSEPHAFLQVDALGRVPFSSIRRPRPLLEVDPPNSSTTNSEQNNVAPEKPLEQEPMLAARVAIEDGLCLLLDVDDIDRFLKRRRQELLEGLATSLQLVDPLGKNGQTVGNDDMVFLRVLALPKGRKLLSRYLQLLPASDLLRVVCMAIFRHLRFLFGDISRAAEATSNLVRTVSSCVRRMDLGSLSACLAAVVCSSEQPPLRPLSSSAGNGASVVLVSVLEQGAELYDGIMQSSSLDPAEAIKRELPMELLRASIPHTNEYQKKMLYDLSQRSLVGQEKGNAGQAE